MSEIFIQDHLPPCWVYREVCKVLFHILSILSRCFNDYHKFKTGVCFLDSGIREDTCCTQEPLYSVSVEIVRLTDSGLPLDAHVRSKHVQKGGVELGALCKFRREAAVMLLHLQMLVSLSTQQVKRPRLLSHWLCL